MFIMFYYDNYLSDVLYLNFLCFSMNPVFTQPPVSSPPNCFSMFCPYTLHTSPRGLMQTSPADLNTCTVDTALSEKDLMTGATEKASQSGSDTGWSPPSSPGRKSPSSPDPTQIVEQFKDKQP